MTQEVGEFQAPRPEKAHLAADPAGSQKLRIRAQEIGPFQARPPQIAANVAADFRSSGSPETSETPKLAKFRSFGSFEVSGLSKHQKSVATFAAIWGGRDWNKPIS